MRIAIAGTGISGLTAAHLLHPEHRLTLYEAADHVGGHTLTSDVELDGRTYPVDAGFVVYNEVNYPLLVRLFDRLGVATRASDMSFSVKCQRTGLEYRGSSLGTVFAQRRNLLRWRFLRMLLDIWRFNRLARARLASADPKAPLTLGEFVGGRFSHELADHYLVPMTAAIWSTDPQRMRQVPVDFLLSFLDNHGLLSIGGHFTWRTVCGGSQRYVDALVRPFRERIRLRTPVRRIRRRESGVEVTTDEGSELFDQVIVATHSDQALAILAEPTAAEREVLGAIAYQTNEAVLHTDASVLPRRRRARASWNYLVPAERCDRVAVTYDMSRLQGFDNDPPFCVSLNLTERIDPERILRRFSFTHPLYTAAALAAQRRHGEVSGADRIHYCGAYWGHGFHEDGVASGVKVAERFGRSL